jgi:predicted enzyme related to lactoylglutathione lyase
MKYGMVDTAEGPASINGGVGRSHDRHVSVYAQVEDLQATLDRVERLGGKTVPKLAMFADPAGYISGLLLGKKAD